MVVQVRYYSIVKRPTCLLVFKAYSNPALIIHRADFEINLKNYKDIYRENYLTLIGVWRVKYRPSTKPFKLSST